jgi:hypothetical protein
MTASCQHMDSGAVSVCTVPRSDENRTLNLARRYRKIVYHTSSRDSKDLWVCQLYTQNPSGLRFVAAVRIGCSRYRISARVDVRLYVAIDLGGCLSRTSPCCARA